MAALFVLRNAIVPTVQLTAVMLIAVAWLALWPGTGAADPAEDDPAVVKLDPDYAAGKQAHRRQGLACGNQVAHLGGVARHAQC